MDSFHDITVVPPDSVPRPTPIDTASPNDDSSHAPRAPIAPASVSQQARSLWPAVLRILISAGFLAFIISRVDLGRTVEVMRGANLYLLIVLMAVFFSERFLSAYRWYVLIRIHGKSVTFGTVIKATFLGGFLGGFLPGTLGTESVRVLALTRVTSNLAMSFSTVLVDRLLGLLVLSVMVLTAVWVAPAAVGWVISGCAWLVIGVLLLGWVLLPRMSLPSWMDRVPPGSWVARVRVEMRKVYLDVKELLSHPPTIAWVIFLAVLFQVIRIGISPVAAMALGIDTPIVYFFVYVPIIIFLMMMPLSVGGVGVREAGFVYFFGSGFMSPEEAFTLAILMSAFTVISALPGAVFCVIGVRQQGDK